jgi:hydroxylysine kinase
MDLFRFDPPELSDDQVRAIAADLYQLTGDTLRLRGERAHNTRFVTASGETYVLRVASASEPDAAIEGPALALQHLARTAPDLPVARVVPASDGRLVPECIVGGQRHLVRLETFLSGCPFDDDQRLSSGALHAIGAMLGRVAVALRGFEHASVDGFLAWDIANGLALDDELTGALPVAGRQLAERARPAVERATAAMPALPRQVIHNDGHPGNLLRADPNSEWITGLIDFGDMVRTVAAADLGVAGAGLVTHQPDPASALASLVDGYHQQRPLTPAERAAIPDLVTTRLVLSALLIQYQIDHAPHMVAAVTPERAANHRNLSRWLDLEVTV